MHKSNWPSFLFVLLIFMLIKAGATAGMSRYLDIGQMKAGMDMVERGRIVAQQGVVSLTNCVSENW